jgi:hypothetical protein
VNLPDVPEELLKMWFGSQTPDKNMLAFLDTNNCPWVEEFLEENHIAKRTGIFAPSGFCTYPLYEFHQDSTWE